ncbi:hypothetical protein G4B84_004765 [Aspergillus flavus NRRL3357]|nr:uncharacterized protein G4B84_004765 [Aspergillus flavus NRRL3357]QMW29430.1 hypothetical protein G4B84_004765 [Aspergillus flavus NRRL3357]
MYKDLKMAQVIHVASDMAMQTAGQESETWSRVSVFCVAVKAVYIENPLEKHMLYKCETCGASFEDQAAWEKHMDDKVHQPECETYRRTFGIWRACDQYIDNTDHWAPRFDCQTSSREFSQSTANQHMAAIGYWADVS